MFSTVKYFFTKHGIIKIHMLVKCWLVQHRDCAARSQKIYLDWYYKIISKQQMKQNSRVLETKTNNIVEWLSMDLAQSSQLINDTEVENQITDLMNYRQNKMFYFFTNDLNTYFRTIWDNIIESNAEFEGVVLEKMAERQSVIEMDLLENRLKIVERAPILPMDYDEQTKNSKLTLLKQQSDNLKRKINEINDNLEANRENQMKDMRDLYTKLYDEQKIKQTEEEVKRYKQAQIERRKKLQEQRKRQQEELLKKEAEIKQHEEELIKAKKQEILRKKKEQNERRQKQKEIREQRNTQYMRIRKSINEKPPLYQKIYDGYSKRYIEEENERLNRMHSERKHYLQHITSKLLQKHEKDYDELRIRKQRQRQERKDATDHEAKSRAKVHSSYELKKPADPKQLEKQQAKEKIQKMKQYRSIVKQKFKPKIDEDKRKELMNMIEEMDLGRKHVKRVRLDNGSVMYEELKPVDAKMIGMGYLQQAKQMAAKARQKKKQQKNIPLSDPSNQMKKPINYLEQLRKNRPAKIEKASFMERKNMSYDDKVKKVMQDSQKLSEITKQNEMMLKFGKFKTSQQILACKEEIDQNYLDIVNMKLKLILSQHHKDDDNETENDQY